MQSKTTIFISHPSRDEPLAEILKKWIAADFLDFPTIFLAAHMQPGTVWPQAIVDSLRAASIVCVLRSERTQTRWVAMEIGAAMVTGATLIPVCYGDLKKEDLEEVLAAHQAVNVRSSADLNKLYQAIALAIGCKTPAVSRGLVNEVDLFHRTYQPEKQPQIYAARNVRRINIEYDVKSDGTVKTIAPITGTLIWTVPGRGRRPLGGAERPKEIEKNPPERCSFCATRYRETSPEIWRVEKEGESYRDIRNPAANMVLSSHSPRAEFRRIANKYPILSYRYWRANYGYEPDEELVQRYDRYTATPEGRDHVDELIRARQQGGEADPEYRGMEFFCSSHDLIVARQHFREGAVYETDVAGSGDLTQDDHYQYFRISLDTATDIYRHNRRIKYVTVFQNWRELAGATVAHLHKQVVGIDEYGLPVTRYIEALKQQVNPFEDMMEWARGRYLVLARNAYATAFIDVGHRYPTIAVFANNAKILQEQTEDEIRGVSDLTHACHAAIGSETPTNEEWYYRPPDVEVDIPWHVLILYRRNTLAGFEHAARIYINYYPPEEFRSDIRARLVSLGRAGVIPGIEVEA